MPELRITDYATLVTAVTNWLNRDGDTGLTDRVPTFIQFAESMFDRDIRWRHGLVRDVIDKCPGVDEPLEILPADFLEMKSVRFNTSPPVYPEYFTPRQLEQFRAENPSAGGTPRAYTILGTMLQFDRSPAGQELEIWAYVEIPRLSVLQTSNMLLLKHPDIYLYGTLIQAEPFLKFDERLALWRGLYESAAAGLNRMDKRAEKSPGPITVRSSRPVV